MDCKVCTKCDLQKNISEFSKGKSACKRCVYDLYTRPSVLRRLSRQGKTPRHLQYKKTKEEKREVQRKALRAYRERKKSELPPPIPKPIDYAKLEKPPVIRTKMSDYMTPEQIREHKNAKKRQYRKENKEKHAEQRKRDYLNAKNKPEFRIAKNIRKRLKKFMKPGTRIGSFSKMVGCTKEELIKHLESLFEPGMNWDNYGLTGWHIDHIKPLAAFDMTDKNTWKEINHYTNLRPMWADVNNSKSNYWMGTRWEKGKPVTD